MANPQEQQAQYLSNPAQPGTSARPEDFRNPQNFGQDYVPNTAMTAEIGDNHPWIRGLQGAKQGARVGILGGPIGMGLGAILGAIGGVNSNSHLNQLAQASQQQYNNSIYANNSAHAAAMDKYIQQYNDYANQHLPSTMAQERSPLILNPMDSQEAWANQLKQGEATLDNNAKMYGNVSAADKLNSSIQQPAQTPQLLTSDGKPANPYQITMPTKVHPGGPATPMPVSQKPGVPLWDYGDGSGTDPNAKTFSLQTAAAPPPPHMQDITDNPNAYIEQGNVAPISEAATKERELPSKISGNLTKSAEEMGHLQYMQGPQTQETLAKAGMESSHGQYFQTQANLAPGLAASKESLDSALSGLASGRTGELHFATLMKMRNQLLPAEADAARAAVSAGQNPPPMHVFAPGINTNKVYWNKDRTRFAYPDGKGGYKELSEGTDYAVTANKGKNAQASSAAIRMMHALGNDTTPAPAEDEEGN